MVEMLAEDPREHIRRLIVERLDFGKKPLFT